MEIRPLDANEVGEALGLILDQPGLGRAELRAQVASLREYMKDQPLGQGALYGVSDAGRIVSAGFCLDSPGRAALLFVPSMALSPECSEVTVALLGRLVEAGHQRGMRLFQVLVPPDSPRDSALFEAAGFDRLAELIYLQRPTTLPLQGVSGQPDLTYEEYSRRSHGLFSRVIEQTYQDSLDCPKLTGVRPIEDIIAGHKATGEFDPSRWLVASVDGRPAGCILLARVKNRSALELVYMGVVPDARGRGIGKVMLHDAIQNALVQGLMYICLAVDADNVPALAVYRECGFSETMRRVAWVLSRYE
ncbi:MAG: GNAT family N-acetyltransferase [Phycisphaerae bacterium]|nr:GNAT family N-acetyltransferase [Phycisphaerae bacterium]